MTDTPLHLSFPATRLAGFARALRLGAIGAVALTLAACEPRDGLELASPATTGLVVAEASIEQPSPQPEPALLASGDPLPAGVYAVASDSASPRPSTRTRTASRAAPAATTRAPVSTKTHYIEFRSRAAASYGHTFAAIGELNRDGSIATQEIVGLHPATDSVLPWMLGHIVPVPSETGASDGDTEEIYFTARYRITMDKERYDELLAFVRNLQASSPAWHAVFYNCNAFVGDIARHMGLRPPSNTLLFPKEYIEELRALNRA
jgi:hypothetical protein